MVEEVILKMINYFHGDIERINHALKVHSFSSIIAKKENIDENTLKILEIAAVLHDIGIKEAERKYNSSAGNYQEMEGPAVAERLLQDIDLTCEEIERIKFMIGNHHSYNKIDNIDLQILIESDFIVNIYEDKVDRSNIQNIKKKYFKTRSANDILELLYGMS